MLDKKIQSEVAIAALLHDIGKFKQRAYEGDEKKLAQSTKDMEAMLLPTAVDGRYSHRHALWTYDFFTKDLADIINSSDSDYLHSLNIETIARLAAAHHNPEPKNSANSIEYSEIIATADKYSAGNDRVYKDDNFKLSDYLKNPLRPIFSSLSLAEDEKSAKKSEYSYCLKSLCDEKAMVPLKGDGLEKGSYKELYSDFIDALKNSIVDIKDAYTFISKVKDLLYEYTWCIPSATNDGLNDISLYDHSVTTMALALVLLNSEKGNIRVCSFSASGIQSFIFQSKYKSFANAAKIFRGRSFIVAAFSSAMKRYICDRVGIIPFVDVRDAGGGMTLLLPDSEDILKKLEDSQREAEKFILNKYWGTLSFVIDYSIVTSPESFGKDKYLDLDRSIQRKLTVAKNRKFSTIIKGLNPVFPLDEEKELCHACGTHGSSDNSEGLCDRCYEELLLGKKLPQKEDIKHVAISSKNGICEILPNVFINLYDDKYDPNKEDWVWTLNGIEDRYPKWRLNNYTPDLEFSEIAEKAVEADGQGKPFLAYIKIDVDSLGKLISEGFPKKEYSISRFSTFSRSLHFFFNTYVYRLLENKYWYFYTVLSGGDDVFVIAPWNQTLEFVEKLNRDFAAFCCNNKDLHFSVGIAIAGAKEPFALVNSRANELLDDVAKEQDGKHSICYWNEKSVFSLNELDNLIRDEDYLKNLMKGNDEDSDNPLNSSFIYRLYNYLSARLDEKDIAKKYGVYSKLHYDIARNIKGSDEKKIKAINFILTKFNNYKSEQELEKFRIILIDSMYSIRTTLHEEE